MSNKSPEDIIELTDIIEHGPDTLKQDSAGEGVDLSFERELEDLFAESPQEKPSQGESGLPGLDDLHLPDDAPRAEGEGDIDLDGLDALLADAEKSQPEGMDLPELNDDFLKQPAREPAAPAAPAGQALDALSGRLDALDEKMATMGDALAASFKSMLDEAVAGIMAGMPAAAETFPDPEPMIAELRQDLEGRIEALKADMPAPVDEQALAERLKEDVLSALPDPVDEQAMAERVKEEVLAALPGPDEAAEPAPQPLPEEASDLLETRLAAFKDELTAEGGSGLLIEEATARLQGGIDAVQARVDAVQADMSSLADELAERMEQRIAAASALGASPAAPDLSGLASKEELDALRQDLLAEIRKAVPAAAAQVIREEIQALLRESD